jgi:glycosidase
MIHLRFSSRSSRAFAFAFASVVVGGVAAPACASSDNDRPKPDVGGPVSNTTPDGGPAANRDGGPGSTDIAFPANTTFEDRPCTVKLHFEGTANDVAVAGEFTNWDKSPPLPMTKNGNAFELTLGPDANLTAGTLYAYKLIVDGTWQLDPNGTHRKMVDSTMNSAFVLPACKDGPEVTSGALTASGNGDAQVRITTRRATDGVAPAKLIARLDQAPVADGTFKADATGAIDFTFHGLAKGKHRLSLVAVDANERRSQPVDLPFWIEDEAFSYRDGLLYMFMVDRFANGSTANDAPVGMPVEYDADFHGGDLQGALAVLKTGYFEKLGVRTIWLSPINRQTSKYETGDGNQLFSGYHGYWPVRAREVEPRFGGEEALRSFITEAHARGFRVLLDLINNQVHQEHEYVAPHGDWFRTSCQCGTNGCGWSERPYDCMFQPYLPDINWTVAGAATQFVDDAVSWIDAFDFDGFRVDAVKHVESNSIWNLRAELSRRFEQGGARVFMVGETAVGEGDSGSFFGETFHDGFEWIDAYTGPNALDGQFDFPTLHNMADGLTSGLKPLNEVEGELHKAETRYKPTSQHVRFLNGHDNPRIATIAAQDPKINCTWASGCRGDDLPPATYTDPVVFQRLRRALTVLYTIPGIPYLYSGDEVAYGGGPDPDMRRDMRFSDPALASVQMHRPGAQVQPLTDLQLAQLDWSRKLGQARFASRALRRGSRLTLVGDDPNFWVYAYSDGADVAIVAVNRGDAVTSRVVSTNGLSLSGKTSFSSALGIGTATIGSGSISVSLPAGEAAIFLAK